MGSAGSHRYYVAQPRRDVAFALIIAAPGAHGAVRANCEAELVPSGYGNYVAQARLNRTPAPRSKRAVIEACQGVRKSGCYRDHIAQSCWNPPLFIAPGYHGAVCLQRKTVMRGRGDCYHIAQSWRD